MDFVKLPILQHPRLTRSNAERSEGRYWREFKNPVFVKSYAPISHITFSSKVPHRYCVSSGTKIQIYSPKTLRVVKTISRFQLPARCSDIKSDGKLVVSSDDSGLIQVFDLNSRAILRTFREIKQPVHVVKFSPTSTNVLTCSDDSTVRLYDLATSKTIRTFMGHTDYVRAGDFTGPNLVLSGSYDGQLKLWDDRMEENGGLAWSLNHDHPIEKILIHPTSTLAISAGGPVANVWDILGGGGNKQSLVSLSNHQKTITSLCWARGPCGDVDEGSQSTRRLLSGGLDGLVKVYDISTGSYKVRHTIKYSSPILSMAVSPDDSLLVVGCTDGSLSMRKRPKSSNEIAANKATKAHKSLSTANKGTDPTANEAEVVWGKQDANLIEEMAGAGMDTVDEETAHGFPDARATGLLTAEAMTTTPKTSTIQRKKKQRLQTWDKMLKAFRYGDALDSVLSSTVPPNTTFSLIRELMHRDGLHQALSGRDEVSLAPILRLISRHITDPRWFNIASDVLNCIINLYHAVLGKSQTIDALLSAISFRISDELKLHSTLFSVNGQLEMILSGYD
ncbi:hypothetical protein PTTG_02346 [Puccinia triticina 1-1 BBBD Race 1]|uniref:WD_REPEATS_REGION domain-containing protein n=2 Tax=Puccinia triticina TaxID=208348 RepID=A0A0C4ENJ9_PUCT1|nr:uncharacterized protein PtA15_4A205 [Puccinia triticina]OAV99121.1 hypothetical protein PTTG_02346 [Puccinia triticina 1-1 BBBD Race 1]WAQ83757.1 hypothetical protein PtA15_4A205 [Puccinia triticina]WAR54600.1 hypothetical protein PtB15_4B217 [Puccinia triticina]